jgi:flagellar motor switch protein FliN/FliY
MEELVGSERQADRKESHEMSIESLLDIPVEISVEIGRTRMAIGDLLSLTRGSIVELNRLAGESADIYVNEKLVGKGEVVVANERLGVRVLEILTPKERVQKLG